jgi:hypothetical protein
VTIDIATAIVTIDIAMVTIDIASDRLWFITAAVTIENGFLRVFTTIVAMPDGLLTDWSGAVIEPEF